MATVKQKKAVKKLVENGGNVSKAMEAAGYTKATAKTPQKLTESKGYAEILGEHLPDKLLAKKHKELLEATEIGHMVFPQSMSDAAIKELLATVNCTSKKIQRGDVAVHCWFWARNNKAIKDGLDLAYKIKGSYAPEKKELSGGLNLTQLCDSLDD
uniref:Terminase n=1 Tax=viral metagenome TaxID=1070528 RepID=A0A6H1ZC80_9ZZZZ